MKILITRKLPDIAEKLLRKYKFDIIRNHTDSPMSRNDLILRGRDADAILPLLTDRFDAALISKLDKCKIISNYAVGYNNIDIMAATQKNIFVTNTPGILTDATADLAIALLLCCARRIVESDSYLRAGRFKGWEPELLLGTGLDGKTLGIIGAGRIGRATAIRARAFGINIIYTNRSRKPEFEAETGAQKVSISNLLKKSDFVSIHIPLTPDTKHYLNIDKLELLKPGAILINTSRGELIDERHLIKMLKTKRIFAAGLDVYDNEPKINKQLFKLNNVVLLPHIGSATVEARGRMAELAARNIINVLRGKLPLTPVNSIT
jgi:glyoxylate reductase